MSITIFGVVWFILLVFCFFNRNRNSLIFLLLLSMVFQSTNVVVIMGNVGVGPQIITCSAYFFRILFYDRVSEIMISKFSIVTLFFCVIVTISALVNKIERLTIVLYLLQLYIYVLCFTSIIKYSDKYDIEVVQGYIIKITWFVVIMGIIQFLMSCLIIPKFSLFQSLFYNEQGLSETVQFLVERRYPRLFSTFMEPSYCGAFLNGVFFYLCAQKEVFKKNKLLVLLVVVEILMTVSATAYVSYLIGGILLSIYGRNKKMLYILIPVSILAIFAFIIKGDYIETAIINKLTSSSGTERNKWNKIALERFQEKKMFGWGYKQIRASSLIYSILAQTGILGLISYIYMMMSIVIFYLNKKISKDYQAGAAIAVLVVISAQIIACPDLDFCVFWFFMFVIALSYSCHGGFSSYEYGKKKI